MNNLTARFEKLTFRPRGEHSTAVELDGRTLRTVNLPHEVAEEACESASMGVGQGLRSYRFWLGVMAMAGRSEAGRDRVAPDVW